MKGIHSDSTDKLFQAILSLESIEECYAFFEDLCTIKELKDMSQRLETAIMLDKGVNYQDIARNVGTSAATISRVSKCLNYGEGGYSKVIEKLKEKEK